MAFLSKIKAAISNPDKVRPYLADVGRTLSVFLRSGEYEKAIDYIYAEAVGWDKYLSENPDGFIVKRDVLGSEMYLDISSSGISKTLFNYGIRESFAAQTFRRELQSLQNKNENGINVLEIGANIGYYCLLEADTLGDAGIIYAFEPNPFNVDLLEKNISENNYQDIIETYDVALGKEDGTSKLDLGASNQRTKRSNTSKLESSVSMNPQHDSVDVEVRSVQTILGELDILPQDINVIRMDIEGYESVIVPEISDILKSDGPKLLFIELHPIDLDRETIDQILDIIETAGFEIVSVSSNRLAPFDGENPIEVTNRNGYRYWKTPDDIVNGFEIDVDGFVELHEYLDNVFEYRVTSGIELIAKK